MLHSSKKHFVLLFTSLSLLMPPSSEISYSMSSPSFPFLTDLSSHIIISQIPSQLPPCSSSFPSLSHVTYPTSSTPTGPIVPPPPLTAPLSPLGVPEASWYRGQCNPAIRNLQLNPFNLPRLNTKRCPNKSWKNYGPLRNRLHGCSGRRVEGWV